MGEPVGLVPAEGPEVAGEELQAESNRIAKPAAAVRVDMLLSLGGDELRATRWVGAGPGAGDRGDQASKLESGTELVTLEAEIAG